jgi:methyltransferase (TIGR00027 family)
MTSSEPSSTALYIAKKLVFASKEPRIGSLIPDLTVEMSRRYVRHATPGGEKQLTAYERPWVRALVRLVEKIIVPGMTLHYVVRKLALEEVARRSIAEGYSQVVVLGAGFDTLTQRLASDSSLDAVTLIEVDHPATQRVKLDVLRLYGFSRKRTAYLPLELGRADLTSVLIGSASYSPRARTLFIAEGLLMYLEPDIVKSVLGSMRSAVEADLRLAFTFMEPQERGRIAFRGQSRIVDLWLKWRGEPFRWGIRRGELGAFLTERGFDLSEIVDTEAFRRTYLAPNGLAHLDLADGDHLCEAFG